jgi:hypothetical protein
MSLASPGVRLLPAELGLVLAKLALRRFNRSAPR